MAWQDEYPTFGETTFQADCRRLWCAALERFSLLVLNLHSTNRRAVPHTRGNSSSRRDLASRTNDYPCPLYLAPFYLSETLVAFMVRHGLSRFPDPYLSNDLTQSRICAPLCVPPSCAKAKHCSLAMQRSTARTFAHVHTYLPNPLIFRDCYAGYAAATPAIEW